VGAQPEKQGQQITLAPLPTLYTSISLSSPCIGARLRLLRGKQIDERSRGRRTEEVVGAVSLPKGKAMT
jgi:hypothetical protein